MELAIKNKRGTVFTTVYDDADHQLVSKFRWSVMNKKQPYFVATHKGKRIYLHRLIIGLNDDALRVDHIDTDIFNNRRNNLRICTQAQNMRNQNKKSTTSSSKYKGVHLDERGRWKVRITLDGKLRTIGRFKDEQLAAIAYNNAARKYHGEFARLNQITS